MSIPGFRDFERSSIIEARVLAPGEARSFRVMDVHIGYAVTRHGI